MSKMGYVIGSLRNKEIPAMGVQLREALPGVEIFDDWFSPGPKADDFWKEYEEKRGRNYKQALEGWAGKHVFEFDKFHIDRADFCVLILPAGKSGHLELGYMIGKGIPGYILLDKPDRWDVMYQFASGIFFSMEELMEVLKRDHSSTKGLKAV